MLYTYNIENDRQYNVTLFDTNLNICMYIHPVALQVLIIIFDKIFPMYIIHII